MRSQALGYRSALIYRWLVGISGVDRLIYFKINPIKTLGVFRRCSQYVVVSTDLPILAEEFEMKVCSLLSSKKAILALCVFAAFNVSPLAHAQGSDEYQAAFDCALESFKNGYSGGAAAYCVGNSRDPSAVEERAYANVEKAFKAGMSVGTANDNACSFGYAVYVANGSRADNWAEGPQRIDTLKQVAMWWPGRDMSFYTPQGEYIDISIAGTWFVWKDQSQQELVVSDQALQTCSTNQIG